MIAYLQGKIILKKQGFIVLDVQGVGFQVFLSGPSIENIPEEGSSLKLFTYLDVAERSLKLYGFLTFEQLELFQLVKAISGVGAKAALEISSLGALEQIKQKIDKGEDFLKGIPNIGKKKAQKIVLELSGKLLAGQAKGKKASTGSGEDEVFSALTRLGFQKEQINQALSQLPKIAKTPAEKIKQCLQLLGK